MLGSLVAEFTIYSTSNCITSHNWKVHPANLRCHVKFNIEVGQLIQDNTMSTMYRIKIIFILNFVFLLARKSFVWTLASASNLLYHRPLKSNWKILDSSHLTFLLLDRWWSRFLDGWRFYKLSDAHLIDTCFYARSEKREAITTTSIRWQRKT
jgi:hypothetical protein